jgi:hypothetical protein
MKLPPGWRLWWLSYALDDHTAFVVLMDGRNVLHAIQRSSSMSLSPGGQVLGWPVPDTELNACWPLRHRLLTREHLETLAEPLDNHPPGGHPRNVH